MIRIAVFLGAHAVLGVVMRRFSGIADLHCLLIVAAGLTIGLFSARLAPVVWVSGYAVGAEVLWRMGDVRMPYEVSKYSVAAILFVALIRIPKYRLPAPPMIYLCMLFPAIVITYSELSGRMLRGAISFNISGPLALVVAVCFFANTTLSKDDLQKLLLAMIAPLIGIMATAAHGTFTNPDISFNTESIHDTSGNFGPNQVSAVLGLGALLSLHFIFKSRDFWTSAVVFGAMILFVMQAALTFSRGGLYAAVIALLPALFFLSRASHGRSRVLTWSFLVVVVCAFMLYPLLDEFTGGALTKRYQKTSMSGREELAEADLRLWADNPIFGIGLGMSPYGHQRYYGSTVATHNEFTRLLAEHGLFGVAAIIAIGLMAIRAVTSARSLTEKALVSSMAVWSLLFSGANGMRIAAAGFVFGMAFLRLKEDNEEEATPGLCLEQSLES